MKQRESGHEKTHKKYVFKACHLFALKAIVRIGEAKNEDKENIPRVERGRIRQKNDWFGKCG